MLLIDSLLASSGKVELHEKSISQAYYFMSAFLSNNASDVTGLLESD